MLASPWPAAFTHPDWLFEVKWDGVRALWCWDGEAVSVRSRRGRQVLPTYPELSGFRPTQPLVLDGEIVVLDDRGHPSFQMLQSRMNLTDGRRASIGMPVSYMVFDLLHAGENLTGLSLEQRRNRLADVVLPAQMVVSSQVEAAGEALYEAVAAEGLEGIVAKRRGFCVPERDPVTRLAQGCPDASTIGGDRWLHPGGGRQTQQLRCAAGWAVGRTRAALGGGSGERVR